MNELQRDLDDYNKARMAKIQQWSEHADCITQGCSQCQITPYCCYQMVMTPIMEAMVIAEYAKRECPDRLARVVAQGKTQSHLIGQKLGGPPAGVFATNQDLYHRRMEEAAHAWYNMSEPCGFLDENNQCSIYSRRPTMCAAYYVRDTCTRKIGTHEDVPVWDHTGIVAMTLQGSMLAVMDLFGVRDDDLRYFVPMPLGAAVAMADEVLLPHVG